MPPSPIPAPLPPWARTLLQLAPLISIGLQEALQYIHELEDDPNQPPDEWRHVQMLFEHGGNTNPADRYICTFDVINITNGAPDNSWTDTDYTTVDAQLKAIWTAYQPFVQSNLRCIERRYYRRFFNPVTVSPPYPPSGPPERIFVDGTAGSTPAVFQAPQVALSVTEKTTYPRHWGRFYLPSPAPTYVTGSGNFSTAIVDTMGAAIAGAYLALQNAQFFPVVPVTQIQGAPARALLQTTHVQIDDVPDVIRRRRPKTVGHRFVSP